MKTLLLIIVLIININISKGQQNLVPNSSFEDTITCNGLEHLEFNIYYWRGGLGYFNVCRTFDRSVPNNEVGTQYPKGGDSYCGLYTYGKTLDFSTFRNYIQVKLINTLVATKRYKVEFYVSAADVLHAKSNSIGAFFSPDSFFVSSAFLGLIDVEPQVQNNPNNDLSDTANWTLVSGSFVANGVERYLTIGNFLPDSLSNVIPLDSVCSQPNSFNCAVYFYIDDVSVVLDDGSDINESKSEENNFLVYPNPNNGKFSLMCPLNSSFSYELVSLTGEVVKFGTIQNAKKYVEFECSSIAKGIYFLKIISLAKVISLKISIN